MFNNTVSIVVGESTKNYGLTSIVDGASVRQNPSADLTSPEHFRISHEVKGSGASKTNRHMIRIDATKVATGPDGATQSATASAYVILVVPSQVITANDIKDAYARVASFLAATEAGATSDNLSRILANEP